MTNEDVVRSIMNSSNYGVLAQAFVLSALEVYSKQVKEAPMEAVDTSFISGSRLSSYNKAFLFANFEERGEMEEAR